MITPAAVSRIKIVSTVLILGAIALWIWHAFAPLPPQLQTVFSLTQIVLLIHAIEGAIGAALIYRYRSLKKNNPQDQPSLLLDEHLPENTPGAVLKAGLYTFFVGTVGLSEIIKGS